MTRTRPRIVGAALVAAVLLLAACSDDDEPTATSDTSEASGDQATTTAADGGNPYGSTEATEEESTETTAAESTGAGIAVADSDLGSILVDAQGNTLYVFSSDTQGEASTCVEGCSAAWPALTGTVSPGDGVDESLIGTVANADGTEQATYDGWPLYYYAQDTAPGDTNGQGVGGVWWVIGADGAPIES